MSDPAVQAASNPQQSPVQHPPRQQYRPSPHPANQAGWTPGLGSIPDGYAYDAREHTQPLNPVMRHANRSVPSLPTHQHGAQPSEPVPPLPPYDPTAALDTFSAMRISDPIPRGTSAMSYASDPIPRTGTSMSTRPARGPGLPQAPNQGYPRTSPPQQQPPLQQPPSQQHQSPVKEQPSQQQPSRHQAQESVDVISLYTYEAAGSRQNSVYSESGSGEGLAYDAAQEPDRMSTYSYDTASIQGGQGSQEGAVPAAYPNYYYPQQGWAQAGYGYPGAQQMDYNAYYAQSAMGMAPQGYANGGMHPDYAAYYNQSIASSQSTPYFAGGSGYAPSISPTDYNSDAQSLYPVGDDGDPMMRPPLDRSGTTNSVTLRTQKSKAIDLSAPPYTKEYIDQYRQRIKGDPDPESHFAYAKYLIDAAKKIGANAKDQRSVRKYRDTLIQEALKVIRRLATQGEPYDEAQFFLANCHGTGALGLQVDHERAYHLYLQAAKQNNAAAAYRVAVCNEIGVGTRKEPARAIAFYRKSASLGDTAAMYKLGMILLNGTLGEQKNLREAIAWLRRAAEQADEENPHALHELGLLHEMQNGAIVPYDPAYAKRLFTQAAQLGYTQSQCKLGQCYELGALTCPVDPKRSIAWYTKAAEKGNADAELALSGWYLTGCEGVLKQSDSEAYLWARRAANKGLSKAEYAVGYYAEVGIGIKADIEFAKRWYMRAAAQGNKRAMNRLTEMKRQGNKRTNVARPTRQEAKDECVIC